MNKLLKIVIGFVAVFVLAIVAVFYFTSGMTDTAEAFFHAIKKQDIAAARSYLSEDFQASTDEAALKEFLSRGALLNYKETSWSNRQVSGGRGELNGEVTTDTGGVIPLKLMFVKENGQWKIYGIQKPTAGLQTEESSPNIPGKADQVALAKLSMHDFAVSVNNKSMEYFRSTISQLWQKQFTTQQLDDVFADTYKMGLDFTILDSFEPVLEPTTTLGENQELILTGYFPTNPNQVHFTQKYVYEGVTWKLIGFKFSIR
jgi:hypothetical protein